MANIRTSPRAAIDPAALAAELAPQHVADLVDTLNGLSPEIASRVLTHLPLERAVEALDEPELASAGLIERLPAEQAAILLSAMSADRAAEVFRNLGPSANSHLLALLDPEAKVAVQQLLAFPPHTAGSLMTTEYVSVPATCTIGDALQYIREVARARETIYAIYSSTLRPARSCGPVACAGSSWASRRTRSSPSLPTAGPSS
jgi:magnesium transporter